MYIPNRNKNPNKTTIDAARKYKDLVKDKASEYGVSLKTGQRMHLDRELSTDEIRSVFRTKTRDADVIYAKARLNSNMNPLQREFIEEITTLRHVIHSNELNMFYGSCVADMVNEYAFRVMVDEGLRNIGIDLPIAELNKINLMHTYEKIKDEDIKDYSALFVKEFNELNESFEAYFERIDKEFGSSYKPEGHLRGGHSPENDQYKILKQYDHSYRKLLGDMDVMKYTNAIHNKLRYEFGKAGFPNVSCKLAFKDFSVYNGNTLTAVELFIECPPGVDQETFNLVLTKKPIRYNGVTAVFDIVDNVRQAVERKVAEKYDLQMPSEDKEPEKDIEEEIPDRADDTWMHLQDYGLSY